jgi:hypothetical protein
VPWFIGAGIAVAGLALIFVAASDALLLLGAVAMGFGIGVITNRRADATGAPASTSDEERVAGPE